MAAIALVMVVVTILAGPAFAQLRPSEPEGATGRRSVSLRPALAKRHMVAAAHPLAAEAGREILRAGGNAMDAAVAVQLVLGIVEPQSSGIGGGAFVLHWSAVDRRITSFDGRETAPKAAREDRFLVDGQPRTFDQAAFGALSVGVPGAIAALELAHKRHGRLPWDRLFDAALRLAEEGAPVSARLHGLLAQAGPSTFSPTARAYYFDAEGKPRPVGARLANAPLAGTLQALRTGGAAALRSGPVAEAILAALDGAARGASDMTAADLAGYEARERAAVCVPYRGHRVCGMGAPSSGGTTVAMILKLAEPLGVGIHALNRTGLHALIEAQRLAYADRGRYMADPDFVTWPAGLLEEAYLAERRRLIDPRRVMPRVTPGSPPSSRADLGDDLTVEGAGTSHYSIVDGDGNAVSVTSSIETAFGSRLMAAGFLLNNQLTDFSFQPKDAQGRPVANRVEGGKRPRSSMAPTMIFDGQGRLAAVLGSPGGGRIILYVAKAVVGLIDWGLDAQAAASLANFGSQGGPAEVEDGLRGAWLAFMLRWQGHGVSQGPMTSGLHIVKVTRGGLEGGADPRREGVALGD